MYSVAFELKLQVEQSPIHLMEEHLEAKLSMLAFEENSQITYYNFLALKMQLLGR